jgi:hypothetical protein
MPDEYGRILMTSSRTRGSSAGELWRGQAGAEVGLMNAGAGREVQRSAPTPSRHRWLRRDIRRSLRELLAKMGTRNGGATAVFRCPTMPITPSAPAAAGFERAYVTLTRSDARQTGTLTARTVAVRFAKISDRTSEDRAGYRRGAGICM